MGSLLPLQGQASAMDCMSSLDYLDPKVYVAIMPTYRIKPYLGFGVLIGSASLSARRTFGTV